jgi:hypothetical protein
MPLEFGQQPFAERPIEVVHEKVDGLLARQRRPGLWLHTG